MKKAVKIFGIFLAGILTLLLFLNINPIKASGPASYTDVTPEQALQIISSQRGEVTLLDVRTASEFESGHITGARLIPVADLEARIGDLDPNSVIIVYCKSGMRSQSACELLVQKGFTRVYNISGGIEAWKTAGLPVTGDDRTDGCQQCLSRLAAVSSVSNTEKVSSTAPGYCNSIGGSTLFEYINNVSYELLSKGTLALTVNIYIANPTGCESGNPCPEYDNSPEFVNAWIDWNGNGLFDDSEKVIDVALTGYLGIGYSGTMATAATVAVPDNPVASPWMRVNLGWGYDPDNPCDYQWTWGNVVDKQINFNDLSVKDEEISITTPSKPNDHVTVSYKIHNSSNEEAKGVAYKLSKEFGGKIIEEAYYENIDIPAKGEYEGTTVWAYDFDKIVLKVDPDSKIEESNENNNEAKTHSISGTVKNSSGDKLPFTRVEWMEWAGANSSSKYTCFTDSEGKYLIINNLNSLTAGASGYVKSSLEYSPERDPAATKLKIYDESEWGDAQDKAANAKTYWFRTENITLGKTKDFISKDIQFQAHNCLIVYDSLIKAYKYWSGYTPSLAPANLIEVEVNNNDFPAGIGNTSYQLGPNLHINTIHGSMPSIIDHEYTHAVHSPWNLAYDPVGENFAIYGSCKIRNTNIYQVPRGDATHDVYIDLANLEDTDGDAITNTYDYGYPVWFSQLAGVWWELNTNKVITALQQGAATAKDAYDKYEGSPNRDTKLIFRKHGINTAGWLPAGPGDPDIFTGVYSDAKVDGNSDGLAEYLNMDCGLNITATGSYYIYGFLEDTAGQHYCFASTQQSLNTGNQTVTLSFDGRSIFENRLSGQYILSSVYIADSSYNEIDYRINPFTTTTSYTYNEFQHPAVYLSGNFDNSGVDTNGDSIFDYLRVGIELDIAASGNYRVDGQLFDSAGNFIVSASTFLHLNAGSQFVDLDFNGATIRGHGVNGPYKLQGVYIFDENDMQVGGSDVLVYDTSAYQHTLFQMPGAGFSGAVTNQGNDTDSDSLFNYLNMGFSLTATSSGNFQVRASLFSNTDAFITSALASYNLGTGTSSQHINLDGEVIRKSATDGPYHYILSLYDASYNLIGSVSGNTSSYTCTQFQMAPEDRFTLGYTDSGTDTNSDGLYNYLTIYINASTSPGSYKLGGYLYDQNNNLVSYTSQVAYLGPVEKQVSLDFKGQDIWSSAGGVFHLALAFHDNNDIFIAQKENAYYTASYDPALFIPAAASLRNSYSDQGSDTNLDNLYDFLDVNVGVSISTAGTYSVEGSLFDNGGNEIDTTSTSGALQTGDQVLTLRFSGKNIYENAVNGPYQLVEVKLLDSAGTVIGESNPGYSTAAYNYNSFGPLIHLTHTYSDQGNDSDSDGIYEYLSVDIGVILANPGFCVASGRLVDGNGNEIVTSSSTKQCEAGTPQTVRLDFDGNAIFNHQVNGPYYLKDVYVYHTGDPNAPDYSENAYTTASYQYVSFGILANGSPIASNDSCDLAVNHSLSVLAPGVLANDSDPESDPITAVKADDPQHGTLILNADGSFTYTPETDYLGTDSFTYKANDGFSFSNIATVSLNIEAFAIAGSSQLPPGEIKTNYKYNLQVQGGTAPYTWTVPKTPAGNVLPAGLKIAVSKTDPSNGVLSGKPTAKITQATSYSFYIQVADKAKPQNIKVKQFTMTLYPPISLSVPSVSQSTTEAGLQFTWSPAVIGGSGHFNWIVSKGSLPGGLSLNPKTGVIAGIPTSDGTFKLTLAVTDTASGSASKPISLKVYKSVIITPPNIKAGTAGKKYSLSLKATGGKTPYIWSSENLPTGVSIDSKKGTITINKPLAGEYNFAVKVTDTLGGWDFQDIKITITP